MATAWDALGLDSRLVRAAIKMGLEKPNLVQEKTIPIALEGKDILCRARTGSGKTAAYCLPVLQRILTAKQVRRRLAHRSCGWSMALTRFFWVTFAAWCW